MLSRDCKAWTLAATIGAAAAGIARADEAPACHGAPSAFKVYVTTEGVRSNHGYVVANLYGPNKRRWLVDNGWLGVWRDPAARGDQTLCFYAPAPGRYALVMFHDANADGDLNLGPLGPKEGYGFSNNVRPFLAPPTLQSALFDVARAETRVTIRLHYPPMS